MLDGSKFDAASTSVAAKLLADWGKDAPTVIVANLDEESVVKSFRNLARVVVLEPNEVEVGAIVWAQSLPRYTGLARRTSEEGVMSLHPAEILIRPVISEKSYGQIAQNRYTFKVHKDAHKTQVRQAVEQLFDVKVVNVNILKVQAKPKRRGLHQGHPSRLEEGRRPAQAGRLDRDLRGSAAVMPIRRYKPTSPGRRFMSVSTFEEITKSTPEKSLLAPVTKKGGRNNNGRITTRHQGGGHKRRYRDHRLQAP